MQYRYLFKTVKFSDLCKMLYMPGLANYQNLTKTIVLILFERTPLES